MKIFCVHAQINWGGADRRIIDLANTLAKEGHQVSLYLMSRTNYQGFEINPDIQIRFIDKKSKIAKTQWLKNLFSLRKELKKEKPDLAVSFSYPINIQLLLARKGTGTKVLISERGNPEKQPEKGIWRWLRNRTYPKTDGIVFQTQGARSYYLKNIKLDGRVIHNPVDIGDVRANPEGNKIVAHVGRLDAHKNQRRLLYAFSVFVKTHPEYRLRICGGGYMAKELVAYAKELGINEKINWMGRVPDPYAVISRDDFFVLSSDFEGMPNVLLEAMAIGMPCIASDCAPGGARELIRDGENGLLCALDDGTQMAEKMAMLAENMELAANLGSEAAQMRDTHSPQNIYAQWMAYIEEIVK